jgi:hypothetical protein
MKGHGIEEQDNRQEEQKQAGEKGKSELNINWKINEKVGNPKTNLCRARRLLWPIQLSAC